METCHQLKETVCEHIITSWASCLKHLEELFETWSFKDLFFYVWAVTVQVGQYMGVFQIKTLVNHHHAQLYKMLINV